MTRSLLEPMERDKFRQNHDGHGTPHFTNLGTGEMWYVGQSVTIRPNHSFSDGKRHFVIERFSIAEKGHQMVLDRKDDNTDFEFVYAIVENKGGWNHKDIHLSDLVIDSANPCAEIALPQKYNGAKLHVEYYNLNEQYYLLIR